MIENFSELPPEERARLVEIERRNIEKSNETLRLENERKKQRIEQLEALAMRQHQLKQRVETFVAQINKEKEELARERERILAS